MTEFQTIQPACIQDIKTRKKERTEKKKKEMKSELTHMNRIINPMRSKPYTAQQKYLTTRSKPFLMTAGQYET